MGDHWLGITGGFAPPTPKAIHVISRSAEAPSKLSVVSQTRADGTPSLSDAQEKSVDIQAEESSIDQLHKILEVSSLFGQETQWFR
jgi:F0F1-type ATP synthase epsilon subunit